MRDAGHDQREPLRVFTVNMANDVPGADACPCRMLRHVSETMASIRAVSTSAQALDVAPVLARLVDSAFEGTGACAACESCERIAPGLRHVIANSADLRLTLAALARSAGLSKWHFSRLVVRHTGSGFRVHLQQLRVLRALLVLQASHLSIKETAARVGYDTAAELHRQMMKHLKIAPSHVRSTLISRRSLPGRQ